MSIELHIGEKFFKYKQDVNTLRDAVERHFSKVINQIEAGLPEVVNDDKNMEDIDMIEAATWTCPTCTNTNSRELPQC